MALQIERIPTLMDNYTYLLICDQSGEAAIVDAPEVDPVVARVDACGAKVGKILSTHHHPDHSMANPELAKRYNVPVYGHQSDSERLPGMTHGLEEGDRIQVGQSEAHILFIPAHTKGHIAYVFENDSAVFSGDTLFVAGCGRLFEGTPEMMYTALVEKLAKLADNTRVFCGHEYTESNLVFANHVEPDNAHIKNKLEQVKEIRSQRATDWHAATDEEMTIPSTIGEERLINPFMRASSPEELGRIRSMKDNF